MILLLQRQISQRHFPWRKFKVITSRKLFHYNELYHPARVRPAERSAVRYILLGEKILNAIARLGKVILNVYARLLRRN